MSRLSKRISDIIEDQLSSVSVEINGEDYSLADLLENFDGDFDVSGVAKQITNLIASDLESRKFTFQQSQFLSTLGSKGAGMGLSNYCNKCGRLQGEWVSGSTRISDDKLLKFGTQVILPD